MLELSVSVDESLLDATVVDAADDGADEDVLDVDEVDDVFDAVKI